MNDTTNAQGSPGAGQGRKTLAIRLTEQQRAQLDIVAQLNGRTVTEEIRLAIEHWIEQTRSNPQLVAKADTARAEIEREAEARRSAITALFGDADTTTPPTAATSSARPGRRGKGTES